MSEEEHENTEFDERTRRELTQLADGTLSGPRRTALQARVGSSPELAAALERQRAAVTALRSLELAAPAALRERVAAEAAARSGAAAGAGGAATRRRRLSLAGGLATACAAALLLAVLSLPSGGGGPSVEAAARLAARPATQASVAVDPGNPKLLDVAADGVRFPNLEGEFGWRQAGARADELDGRRARTVYYERGGQRIGYTILAGDPIAAPDAARTTRREGVVFASLRSGPDRIVTWRRDGHTCVLAGRGVSEAELLALASWRGKGSVSF